MNQSSQLQNYRKQIDRIDHAIIKLLARRFAITNKVGLYKAKHNLSSTDRSRELAQMAQIEILAVQYNLNKSFAKIVIKKIIELATKNHKRIAKSLRT